MKNQFYLAVNYDGQEICSNYYINRYCDIIKDWNEIDRQKGFSEEELLDEELDEYKYWTDESTNYNKDIYDSIEYYNTVVYLPKGTIEKLTGKDLSWEDEPIKIER